jgi:hypothetical protein
MAPPIRTIVNLPVQSKDAFNWGLRSGTAGVGTPYRDAASENYVLPTIKFSTEIVGRRHTKYQFTNPPESWERSRVYVSFYTSGFRDVGWVESVKLRMYIQQAVGIVKDTTVPPFFQDSASNWNVTVFTVSGGYNVLHQPYFSTSAGPGQFAKYYGFGDDVAWENWGVFDYPNGSTRHVLEEYIASGIFFDLANAFGTNIIRDISNNPHTFTSSWVDIPLPIEKINTVGETHLRLVHLGDHANIAPLDGGGAWIHHEFMVIESFEGTNRPELEITYVTPATTIMNELRMCDLSMQRHLQQSLLGDDKFSDVTVLDGYPEDEVFDKDRNVSLEFVSSSSDVLEIGGSNETNRRFFIDIVCDKRGELLDLQNKIDKVLHGGTYMKDFRYGFVNPPPVGLIKFHNFKVFDLPEIVNPDRAYYHSIVSVDTITVRSGFLWQG